MDGAKLEINADLDIVDSPDITDADDTAGNAKSNPTT
jgi:hypothetical protein